MNLFGISKVGDNIEQVDALGEKIWLTWKLFSTPSTVKIRG
jgi:hypothetical protein